MILNIEVKNHISFNY